MRSNTHSHRCTATKADGTPCNAWAVRGSEPPRCVAHSKWVPSRPPDAEPVKAVEVTGAATVDIAAIVADLYAKQRTLSAYIDTHLGEMDTSDMARLLALHGQNASRLGRLLRDQRALSGDAADGMSKAIAQALDELAGELGVEL